MTCYETLFVVKPTLTEEEIAAQITKVKDVLAKENAELIATDDMGMRKLAYPVAKNDRGYYTVLYFKGEGALITELERNLKINEDIIKFLTVKYVKNKELAQFDKLVAATAKKAPVEETVAPVEVVATPEVTEVTETPVVTETAETTEA